MANITESIMGTMETKRTKRIIALAVIIVLVIAGICFFLLWNRQKKGVDETGYSAIENLTLDVGEDTPSIIWSKAYEGEESAEDASESQLSSSEEVAPESGKESSDELNETTEGSQEETPEDGVRDSEKDGIKESNSLESVASDVASQETPAESAEVTAPASISPEDRVIDFATLQAKKNAHIYAWINVPGTNIDYPVLRHPTDDGYYLYHNLNGSSGYPGCIYTENYNSKDWTDPVTVLYGHDMRSTGTMFHQLHKFEKQNFFDTYEYIYIYTPEKTLKYQIFAAYVHSNEHLLGNHNFSNQEEFDSFFNVVKSSAGGVNHVRDGVSVTSDSKVITLSTCIKNKPNNRYLIFGVLTQ